VKDFFLWTRSALERMGDRAGEPDTAQENGAIEFRKKQEGDWSLKRRRRACLGAGNCRIDIAEEMGKESCGLPGRSFDPTDCLRQLNLCGVGQKKEERYLGAIGGEGKRPRCVNSLRRRGGRKWDGLIHEGEANRGEDVELFDVGQRFVQEMERGKNIRSVGGKETEPAIF